MEELKDQFKDREVEIFTRDATKKFGIVLGIDVAGVTFLITRTSNPADFPISSIRFISFSAGLSFSLVE